MSLSRRRLVLGLSAAALPMPSAAAAPYPQKPVTITVGVAPGSSSDLLARILAESLSGRFSHRFVVVNRPGAGANIATEAVIREVADGHSLLWASTANAINASLFDKLSFNFIRDVTPINGFARVPLVMIVNPSVPARTVEGFLSHAKVHADAVTLACPSWGTSNHMAGELFMKMSGVRMTQAVYKGATPAMVDLMAGHVQVMFDTLSSALPRIRDQSVRALAVTSATRLDDVPEVPAMCELVPGYEVSAWFGLVAPRGVPDEVVSLLNREINSVLADPSMRRRFAELCATSIGSSSAEFSAFIKAETEKWATLVKYAGLKATD